jgi:hypothetical protein
VPSRSALVQLVRRSQKKQIAHSGKAEEEVYEVLQYVNEMRVRTGSNGWLLVGDFNCSSDRMINYITSQKIIYGPMTTCYPTMFHTHDSGKKLDYILASSDEVLHNLPSIAPPGVIVVTPRPGKPSRARIG